MIKAAKIFGTGLATIGLIGAGVGIGVLLAIFLALILRGQITFTVPGRKCPACAAKG